MKQLRSVQVLAFIAAMFRSAWPLELLCLLRSDPGAATRQTNWCACTRPAD